MSLQIKQNLKNSYDDKAVLRDQSELPAWKLKGNGRIRRI